MSEEQPAFLIHATTVRQRTDAEKDRLFALANLARAIPYAIQAIEDEKEQRLIVAAARLAERRKTT